MSPDAPERFDHSFMVQMIRDFFLALLAVVLIEVGVKFAMVLYDFEHDRGQMVEDAAERLAGDVKSIMVNQGGPVAARTVYPILKNNHQAIGLDISIQPSKITVDAIETMFSFTPRGLPPEWPDGRFQESVVPIRAEAFCITCHITAAVGDELGRVVVRGYLAAALHEWRDAAQISLTFGMGKILLHTVVLFFLLRLRMEPLLSLHSSVALLAKAGGRLSHRAAVRTRDEFGELARDLNLFLDRVSQVIDDLGQVLTRIVVLNQRLTEVHSRMTDEYQALDDKVHDVVRAASTQRRSTPLLTEEWRTSVEAVLSVLATVRGLGPVSGEHAQRLDRFCAQLRELTDAVSAQTSQHDALGERLLDMSREIRDFSHWFTEMAVIEHRMQAISEQGQGLLHRLTGTQFSTGRAEELGEAADRDA